MALDLSAWLLCRHGCHAFWYVLRQLFCNWSIDLSLHPQLRYQRGLRAELGYKELDEPVEFLVGLLALQLGLLEHLGELLTGVRGALCQIDGGVGKTAATQVQ